MKDVMIDGVRYIKACEDFDVWNADRTRLAKLESLVSDIRDMIDENTKRTHELVNSHKQHGLERSAIECEGQFANAVNLANEFNFRVGYSDINDEQKEDLKINVASFFAGEE